MNLSFCWEVVSILDKSIVEGLELEALAFPFSFPSDANDEDEEGLSALMEFADFCVEERWKNEELFVFSIENLKANGTSFHYFNAVW